jgi:transcriptional regulator GlxA family with amidase domain
VNRRRFTTIAVGAGVAGTLAALGLESSNRAQPEASALPGRPLPVPTDGTIRTAVAIGPGVNVIDLSGPWEVFQDAAVAGAAGQFELYTVGERAGPVDASGGLRIEAEYSYTTSPRPNVVVVPAHDATERTLDWLRDVAPRTDLVMSVCTGAFVVADAGLLDGKTATTHHQSCDLLERAYPTIRVLRRRRFVEHEHVATAGGLSSGIDLALRVVERYLGRDAADATAGYMEYERRSPAIA